jgi:hypothetical protein
MSHTHEPHDQVSPEPPTPTPHEDQEAQRLLRKEAQDATLERQQRKGKGQA